MEYLILFFGLVAGFFIGALFSHLRHYKSELLYTLTTLKEDIVQFHIKIDKLLNK